MDGRTPEDVARRLETLERESRRWKRVGLLVLVGAAAGLVMGQVRAPADTIEARRVVVKDASGAPRGVLSGTNDGAVLELYDKDGDRRAVLGLAGDGSVVLSLSAKAEKVGAWLSTTSFGQSSLQFADRSGTTRIAAGLTADGSSALFMRNSDGLARAGLGIGIDGRPFRFP
jgi:hypothetical protein